MQGIQVSPDERKWSLDRFFTTGRIVMSFMFRSYKETYRDDFHEAEYLCE